MPFLPRANPRFKIELKASVDVRVSGGGVSLGGDRSTRTTYEILLRDVSASGMSFVTAGGAALDKGATITVKLQIAGRTVSLPGAIVWSQPTDKGALSGVRVHPELTDSLTRGSFTRWLSTKK
jgi:hypothetical protein